jgi:hypothetical protein
MISLRPIYFTCITLHVDPIHTCMYVKPTVAWQPVGCVQYDNRGWQKRPKVGLKRNLGFVDLKRKTAFYSKMSLTSPETILKHVFRLIMENKCCHLKCRVSTCRVSYTVMVLVDRVKMEYLSNPYALYALHLFHKNPCYFRIQLGIQEGGGREGGQRRM